MKLNTKIKRFSKSAIEVRSKFPLFALFYFTLVLFLIAFFHLFNPDMFTYLLSVLLSSLMSGVFIAVYTPGIFISVNDYKKFWLLFTAKKKRIPSSFGLMVNSSRCSLKNIAVVLLLCFGCNVFIYKSEILFTKFIY